MLATDLRGFLTPLHPQGEPAAEVAAALMCSELALHLGSILSMSRVEVRPAGDPTDGFVARVTIDEISGGGRTRRTGVDAGATPGEAATAAVIDAVVRGDDLVSAGLSRLEEAGAVRAALVGDAGGDRTTAGPEDLVMRLRCLLLLLEEPGRLAVSAASGAFRAIYTGALDIGIAVEPGHEGDVDRWLDRIVRSTGGHGDRPRKEGKP